MSYEIDYSALDGEEKREAALRDIENYLGGAEKMQAMERKLLSDEIFESTPPSFHHFSFALRFIGVQGYPATVWYEKLFPDVWKMSDEEIDALLEVFNERRAE